MKLKSLALLGALSVCGAANAELLFGITESNRLISFDSLSAGTLASNFAITGLASGERLLGLDLRPATGELYAVSSNSVLYKISFSGVATAVGPAFTPLVNGMDFGFDFNPTVDRIRLTSDAEQNLRLNPITGGVAATDGTLIYAAGDPNFGMNPNIVASAYTNNFAGATTTTLYNIDSATDTLVIQNPPNNGTLNTVGSLGINTIGLTGFDISGVTGIGYAVLTSPGTNVQASNLFTINLATGNAQFIGTVGGTSADRLVGLTAVPEPATMALFAAVGLGLAARRRRKA